MSEKEPGIEEEVMQAIEMLKYVLLFAMIWMIIRLITKGFGLPAGAALFTTCVLFYGGYYMLKDEE